MTSSPRITESVALSVSTKIQGLWAVAAVGVIIVAATMHKRKADRDNDSAMKSSNDARRSILGVRSVMPCALAC